MRKSWTTEKFIERAIKIHGDKYDYSKVEYINAHIKVCIICPEHGEFWMVASQHLTGGNCSKCKKVYRYNTEEWIEKVKQIHGDKYDYSKVIYKNNCTKVCIICPEHGEFWQIPSNHEKYGCSKCGKNESNKRRSSTTNIFITQATLIHNNKYDYSKVEYINNKIKVCIICPEHGEFWQTPGSHLKKHGCPNCKEWKLEKEIEILLKEKNILYKKHHSFIWLKNKSGQKSFDFYLPEYNVAIECQGRQHFENDDYFGGHSEYIKVKERDEIKFDLCKKHNIKVLYFSNEKFNLPKTYFNTIFTSKEKIYKELIS